MDKWDDLTPNTLGQFAFLKIDVVEHSRLIRENPYEIFEDIFDKFGEYIEQHIKNFDGRLWSWSGDGGLVTFFQGKNITLKTRIAVEVAFCILSSLPMFNDKHKFPSIKDILRIRIAVHPGIARYRSAVSRIHSEAINFVSHLEQNRTHPNSISISGETYKEIKGIYDHRFVLSGTFEGHEIYTTDKERRGRFTATFKSNLFLEIRQGLESITGQIRLQINPKRTVIISANRSGAVLAGMLAPNLKVGPVIALNRPEFNQPVNHFVKLTTALKDLQYEIIIVFFAICAQDTLRALTKYLASKGIERYKIVAMYSHPAIARRLRKDRKHPFICAYEKDTVINDEFWDKLPWIIQPKYDHH